MSRELPLKSIPAAILFSVFLGPIGLLYSSVIGAIVMMFLALVAIGLHSYYPIVMVWMICCVWSVVAANKTNQKLIE